MYYVSLFTIHRSETEPTNTSYKASTASTGEQPQDDDPLYSVIDEYKITSHTMPPQVTQYHEYKITSHPIYHHRYQ